MLRKTIALCLLCATFQAQSANIYTIDSANSYVSAYSPVWRNQGPLPGTSPQSYSWGLEWQLTPYAISGTFETEIVQSPFNPRVSRLQFSNIHIASMAPASAGFSLPATLSPYGGPAHYISFSSCSNDGFYGVPTIYSCNIMGAERQDSATLTANAIHMEGELSGFPGFAWAVGPTIPPEITDLSSVAGMYAYSIHAAAVPEPGTCLLLISGLGLATMSSRRRKTKSLHTK